jgi:hypothetical protein
MIERDPVPRRSLDPHPWTEPIDVILRWRRFVVAGILCAWAAVIVLVALLPARVVCEATLMLPNVAYTEARRVEKNPENQDKPFKSGTTVGFYKKLEAAVSDAALLQAAFKQQLTEARISILGRDLRNVLTPLTSGPRDEIARADREDTVTGVRLVYADSDPKRAEMVVNTLVGLVRNAAVALAAQDRIDAVILDATLGARAALAKKGDLTAKAESLQGLTTDLQKLSGLARAGDETRREVVDVTGGGFRYLSPSVQVVGARALEAAYYDDIRMASWRFRVESLRVAFFRRLDSTLRQANASGESRLSQDLPSLIDAESQAFFAKIPGPESSYVRSEVDGIRDVLQSHRTTTAFVQSPAVRELSRITWVLAAMAASALLVLLVTLLGESWRQYHQSTVPTAS